MNFHEICWQNRSKTLTKWINFYYNQAFTEAIHSYMHLLLEYFAAILEYNQSWSKLPEMARKLVDFFFVFLIPGALSPSQAKSCHGEVWCSHSAHLTQPYCDFWISNHIISYCDIIIIFNIHFVNQTLFWMSSLNFLIWTNVSNS